MKNPARIIVLIAGFFSAGVLAATEWQLVPDKGSLSFVFGQAGTDEKGQFRSFPSRLVFDDAALEQSLFDVTIDMKSVDTGDKERDEILLSKDMFDVKQWPQAHFKTLKIEKRGDNEYLAEAELRIRDQTRNIPFPFRLVISEENGKKIFHLQSELNINRLDFGVGQGEWKATTWIANEVKVLVDIQAGQISAEAAPKDSRPKI
jgi:polyisoprenoid-binding protein YceI